MALVVFGGLPHPTVDKSTTCIYYGFMLTNLPIRNQPSKSQFFMVKSIMFLH